MTNFLFLGLQALISSSGLLMLRHAMPLILDKANATALSTWVWGGLGVVFYGASFLMWLYILSRNPVSFAYPLTIGLTLALTVVGSAVLLHERIGGLQIIGIVLMGVAAVFLSIDTSPPDEVSSLAESGA